MKTAIALARRLALGFCVAAVCAPFDAQAGLGYFLPRPFETDGFVEVKFSYEDDDLESGAVPARWSDTFVREKITLVSSGYSYDPRFLLYRVSLSGALSQEKFERSSLEPNGWMEGSGPEYDLRLSLLPEHPYNVSVFAARYEPLFKEQAAERHDKVETLRGAIAQYSRKPYFLTASYTDESTSTDLSSSDVSKFRAEGQYFKRFKGDKELSFGAAYHPSSFSNSVGLSGEATEYNVSNLVNLGRLRLSSSLTGYNSDQQNPASGAFADDQLGLYEQLSTFLPGNLRSNLTYRYQDSDSALTDERAGLDRKLSSKGSDLQFDLIHRLYQSLDTTYTFLHDSRTSSAGETTSDSNALAVDYNKQIAPGRLMAGVDVSRVTADGAGGGTDIVNEPHFSVLVPTGTFVLNQQNVEESSILVFLKSPLPPFESVLLQRDEHYTVTAVPERNTFEIRVFSLPPRFAASGTYDFLVSYRLLAGGYGLRTDMFAGNLSVELLDRLLTPYVSYVGVGPDVLSGFFPGIVADSTTTTVGLLFFSGPLRARGEYQRLDWDISPYDAKRGELQYVGAVTRTIRAYAAVSYLSKHHGLGTSTSYDAPFTEKTLNLSGNIEKHVSSLGMSFSAGGSYSDLHGLVDSRAYTLNALWNWAVGTLNVSAGANAYSSETTGTPTPAIQRDHTMFYFTVRRQLF